jgi:hypothetical protein
MRIIASILMALPLLLAACSGDEPTSTPDEPAADAAADADGGSSAVQGMAAMLGAPGGAHGGGAPGMQGGGAPGQGGGVAFSGPVLETMTTAGYTYVRIEAAGKEIWAAGPATPVELGQEVGIPAGQLMTGFHSSSLDRTFDEVWFVDHIGLAGAAPAAVEHGSGGGGGAGGGAGDGSGNQDGNSGAGAAPHGIVAPPEAGPVEPLADGQTVAAVFGKAAGDQVAIRGRVVKINRGIMGMDWLHIQDGSGDAASKTNDLVVTAATGVQAAPGNVVVVRGTVATDKDFGAGYTYALLVEQATVTAE